VNEDRQDAQQQKVALAMDIPLERGLALYPALSPYVGMVKVGLSLFVEHGPTAVVRFRALGAQVFLDLKLHDIPNTVELAAERAGALGVTLLTVHAQGGGAMLEAAVAGARRGALQAGHAAPRVLAVTVLTSLDEAALASLGVSGGLGPHVERLGTLAVRSGVDGLVCSAREVRPLRQAYPRLFLCTPGIRPRGSQVADQARAETPAEALRAGSDLLVVGRPIYEAADPVRAAASLLAELDG
jgi:orotidine-5'-phosphate decarboxylase